MAAEVEGQFAGVEVVLQLDDTRAFADGRELGSGGQLSVEESNLCWRSRDGSESLVLEYPSIAIHAYFHQAGNTEVQGEGEVEEEEEEGKVTEYRLVPPSPKNLEEVYHAITQCQMLYPDPEQSDSDEQGFEDEGEEEEEDNIVDLEGGEFFTSAEGFDLLSPHGLATLAHLERILQLPTPAEFEATLSNGGHEETPDQFKDSDD